MDKEARKELTVIYYKNYEDFKDGKLSEYKYISKSFSYLVNKLAEYEFLAGYEVKEV